MIKASDRVPVHRRALALFDLAARLCRADATIDAVSALHSASLALRESQYVTYGPEYQIETARVGALCYAVQDSLITIRKVRGEI